MLSRIVFESRLEFGYLAPHPGHVSNFCRPVGDVIEPVDAYCFQTDSCEPLTCVHAGHPVWIRLELTNGAADTFRVRRHLGVGRQRTEAQITSTSCRYDRLQMASSP